jgi:hypothetical protein
MVTPGSGGGSRKRTTRHLAEALPQPTHRRKGAGGQGAPRRDVPRLRRLHPAAQRQGRRLPALQAVSAGAIARRWTEQVVLDAMRAWQTRYGRLPSSYDWSRTHARARAWWSSASAAGGRGVAVIHRRHRAVRDLGNRASSGRGGSDEPIASSLWRALNRGLSHDRRIPGNRGSGSSTRSDRTTVASCSRRGTGRRVRSTTLMRTSSHGRRQLECVAARGVELRDLSFLKTAGFGQ